jgi:hypothetical protein
LPDRKLTEGWSGAPHVRVRRAIPADLIAIAELVPLDVGRGNSNRMLIWVLLSAELAFGSSMRRGGTR